MRYRRDGRRFYLFPCLIATDTDGRSRGGCECDDVRERESLQTTSQEDCGGEREKERERCGGGERW